MKRILPFIGIIILLTYHLQVFGQTGSDCSNAHVISALPFTASALSTTANNILPTQVCGDANISGKDYLFKLVSNANQKIDISLTNPATPLPGIYVVKDCPGVGTCVAKREGIATNPTLTGVTLENGSTYYIIVSGNSIIQTINFGITITTTIIVADDGALYDISSPMSTCGLTNAETLTVTIKNNGINTINSIDVSYKIDNGTEVKETVNQSIVAGKTINHTFANKIDLSTSGKTYQITCFTSLTGDNVTSNNTLVKSITNNNTISTFPYKEDFESSPKGWAAEWDSSLLAYSSWQLAKPNKTVINTAYSGNNAWVTNATATTFANEFSYVLSPCFDFSGLVEPYMYLKLWYETVGGTPATPLGSFFIQYTTDHGNTWANLGKKGDTTWYNVDAQQYGYYGWVGNSGKWLNAYHSLNNLNGVNLAGQSNVQFRFYFISLASQEGVAFDDVQIVDGLIPTSNKPVYKAEVEHEAIYPNPANNILNIDIEDLQDVVILDVLGKTKLSASGSHAQKFDVSDLNEGLYFVIAKTKSGKIQKKLVIKH